MSPKTVLVTGCSAGGIGSALVEAFQMRGLHVFATARSRAEMKHLEKLANVTLLILNVTSPADIASAVETISQRTDGRLDYLVNNAGQNYFMPVLDTDIEEAKTMFDVNFWGALAMTQAFAPLVIAAKGTMVNIGSISGHVDVPWMVRLFALSSRPSVSKSSQWSSGAVQSQGQTNFPQLKLPQNSYYKSVEEDIAKRSRGEDGYKRMNTKVYADRVVEDILGGASGLVWRGVQATIIKWLSALLPKFIMDAALIRGTGLDKLPPDEE